MIAALSSLLEQWINNVEGTAALHAVAGPIDVADLCVVALFPTVALLLNAALAVILRRRRKTSAAQAMLTWHHRAYLALGKPSYILIWSYGVYLAATPILLKLKPEQGLVTLRHAMDSVFELGVFVAVFLFLFRATHVLESHLTAWAATTPSKIDDLLAPLLGTTLRVIVVVASLTLIAAFAALLFRAQPLVG